MECDNRNEEFKQEFGLSEIELKNKLLVYSEKFPHFFEYVTSIEKIQQVYLEIMMQISREQLNLLTEEELNFFDMIFNKFDAFSMLITEEEDLKKFKESFVELTDIFPVLTYNYQKDISTWNEIDLLKNKGLSLEQKQYEAGEYNRILQLVNDPKFILTQNDFLEFIRDFGKSEIDTLNVICKSNTKNEKLKSIKQHVKKIKDVYAKSYHLENRVIELGTCEELLLTYYSDIPSMCMFSEDDIKYYLNPISYNGLLILYNYLRISLSEDALEHFFESILKFVRTNLKDSSDLVNYADIKNNKYFMQDEIDNLNQVDKCIALTYNNIMAYYQKINSSLQDKYKNDEAVSGVRIFDTEFRKQQQWMEEEQEIARLYRLRQKEMLLGQNDNNIEDLNIKIMSMHDQIRVKDVYERMSATMDGLFVFLNGLDLYLNAFPVGNASVVDKVKSKMRTIDEALKESLYLDPELYWEHMRTIQEVNNTKLRLGEERALEEKKDEELLEKDIQIEELEKKEKWLRENIELKKLELKKKEASNQYVEQYIKELVSALQESDIDKITQTRREIIANKKLVECDIQCLDELSAAINDIIEEKIQNEDKSNFERIRQNVIEELGEIHANRLSNDIICVLTTAESLYEKYIKDKQEIKGFDYSCVSAMYYQALEKTYNNLMYKGYIANINRSKDLPDLIKRKNQEGKGAYGYFPNDRIGGYVIVYSSGKNIGYIVKDTCEYGNFIHLLESIISSKYYKEVSKYIEYLQSVFGWKTANSYNKLPEKVNGKINYLVKGLREAKDRRNNAAHGGVIINYKTAKEDKNYVLPQKEADVESKKYRKLIRIILELFEV